MYLLGYFLCAVYCRLCGMFFRIISTQQEAHSYTEKRKLSAYLYDGYNDFGVPSLHSY